MPTAKDRVQVLLEPDEYAELKMLCKEERRSAAAMAAVLITEAIRSRIRNGTFTPDPEDPAYATAKRRQVARQLGQQVQSQEKEELQKFLDEHGTVVSVNRTGEATTEPIELPASKGLSVKV